MKKILVVLFFAICFSGFGQFTQEVEKDVFVTFPMEPTFREAQKNVSEYTLSTDDYIIARSNDKRCFTQL